MPSSGRKIRAARVSIFTAFSLALLKFIAGLFTGSMAILSSGVDSLLDILMSGVNYLAIRQAVKPADESHPFGHGKFETVATLVQAMVIAGSGVWIIFESIDRLLTGTHLSNLGGGTAVLFLSSAVSWGLCRYLRKEADATDSSALRADSLHFSMDVYTNIVLGAGLLAVRYLDAPWLDPLLSVGVALYIIKEALQLVRFAMQDVLDENLPEPVRQEIDQVIHQHLDQKHVIEYHDLRTRRAGSQKIISFHLIVCRHLSVEEGHLIADRLEKAIENTIRGSDVTIHVEPCDEPGCQSFNECRYP
ncbi:MAG: cation diffusion facilitator family transporter [Desulfuromonadales bacterium]